MMRRTRWLILVTVPAVLVAADIAYWRVASEWLRAGLQDWIDARRAQGWTVQHGPVGFGGWPWTASVSVPSLHLQHAGNDIPGEFEVLSSGITISASLYLPMEIDVAFGGPQHLRLAGLPNVALIGDHLAVVVPRRDQDPHDFDLNARNLRVEPVSGPWHMTFGGLNAHVDLSAGDAEHAQQKVAFAASAEAIVLPPGFRWPLGANISSFSTGGTVNGPFPSVSDTTAWAQAWRDNGGSLDIAHLAMVWGPLGLTSSATLALDDQLQPMGSGSGRFVGYAQALDRLAAGGLLTKSAATAAKAVLSLMAATGDADQPSEVDVPLTLQYRTLSMRQVPLVRLPELDLPPK
jgi:hypothetical protein